MDVLCYVWDQCFIGMDTVGYQCLPYITATWLILLREKLMTCTLVSLLWPGCVCVGVCVGGGCECVCTGVCVWVCGWM